MTTQRQDLTLFNEGSIIPHKSLPKEHLFGFISHTQGTSPIWLLNLLVENSLYDTCFINDDQAGKSSSKKVVHGEVVVISLLHDFKFFERDLKRMGIDINDNKHFHFIDLFTDLFSKISAGSIAQIFDQISLQLSGIQSHLPKIVFIEGLEFLLGATLITPIELLVQLNKLHKLSSALFIISSTDKELIEIQHQNDPTLPEFKTFDFLIRILHRSHLNISIRPLETGKAKDVTGTLTISRGTIPYRSNKISEKEYLFLITKDQTTKLFFR